MNLSEIRNIGIDKMLPIYSFLEKERKKKKKDSVRQTSRARLMRKDGYPTKSKSQGQYLTLGAPLSGQSRAVAVCWKRCRNQPIVVWWHHMVSVSTHDVIPACVLHPNGAITFLVRQSSHRKMLKCYSAGLMSKCVCVFFFVFFFLLLFFLLLSSYSM